METSILVTDLAQQFSLCIVDPSQRRQPWRTPCAGLVVGASAQETEFVCASSQTFRSTSTIVRMRHTAPRLPQDDVPRMHKPFDTGSKPSASCSISDSIDGGNGVFQREIHFSASHATLDPDRACSAAQDGTLLLSKTAIRLTRMIVP